MLAERAAQGEFNNSHKLNFSKQSRPPLWWDLFLDGGPAYPHLL
jgi:hypothetical protein